MNTKLLASVVSVSGRFNRAANIQLESNGMYKPMQEYIVSQTISELYARMVKMYEVGNYAFLWTGNYGTGKTSAAIMLAKIICENLNPFYYNNKNIKNNFVKTIKKIRYTNKPRILIPIYPKSMNIQQDILDMLVEKKIISDNDRNNSNNNYNNFINLIKKLSTIKNNNKEGILLIIDEMGNYLQNIKGNVHSINIWQDLAEICLHSRGKIILLGILHKSLLNYSAEDDHSRYHDWKKIEGRYCDLTIEFDLIDQVTFASHIIEHSDNIPRQFIDVTSKFLNTKSIKLNANQKQELTRLLTKCWPLHPCTTLIVASSLTNTVFSQSQRTLFGFFKSLEPLGFKEYISSHTIDELYEPWLLWDYLHLNYNFEIMNSDKRKDWIVCKKTVQQAYETKDQTSINIAKSICVFTLLEVSFVQVNDELLSLLLDVNKKIVKISIDKLLSKSCIVFRKHLSSYIPREGSDFNVEYEMQRIIKRLTLTDYLNDNMLNNFNSNILARRHGIRTGALRSLNIRIITESMLALTDKITIDYNDSDGLLLVILTLNNNNSNSNLKTIEQTLVKKIGKNLPIAYTIIHPSKTLLNLLRRHFCLKRIIENPRLTDDLVARQEVSELVSFTDRSIKIEYERLLHKTNWQWKEKFVVTSNKYPLSRFASDMMDSTYNQSPIVVNELLNVNDISSSATAAVRQLMHHMVSGQHLPSLGIKGYPAHRSLYEILFQKTRLHSNTLKNSRFVSPDSNENSPFNVIWNATYSLLTKEPGALVSIIEIVNLWQKPPFGVKKGLIPVLLLYYLIVKRSTLSLYVDNTFRVSVESFDISKIIQLDSCVCLRYFEQSRKHNKYLELLCKAFSLPTHKKQTLLEIGRMIVAFIDALDPWTKKTSMLSLECKKFREILLRASDPYKFLMQDLFNYFDINNYTIRSMNSELVNEVRKYIQELSTFFPSQLQYLENELSTRLGDYNHGYTLQERAKIVSESTGDWRCKAFAQRISRNTSLSNAITSIATLSINKPLDKWNDMDLKEARYEILSLCDKFLRVEVNEMVLDKQKGHIGYYIRLNIRKTSDDTRTLTETTLLPDNQAGMVKSLVEDLSKIAEGQERQVLLAALAEIYMRESRS